MKKMAEAVVSGKIPLTESGVKNAWDPNNMYKGKDEIKTAAPTVEPLRDAKGNADIVKNLGL
jgi:hypothetical protein